MARSVMAAASADARNRAAGGGVTVLPDQGGVRASANFIAATGTSRGAPVQHPVSSASPRIREKGVGEEELAQSSSQVVGGGVRGQQLLGEEFQKQGRAGGGLRIEELT